MPASYYPPEEPKSYAVAWVGALLIIAAFVLGLFIFPPSFEAPKTEATSNVLFVGRFHPILVHTPVGALLLLILMEMLCLSRSGERRFGDAALLTLIVGAAGSVAAVFAGVMLSREGGYMSGNFTLHQGMGIAGTVGILLALLIRLAAMGKGSTELLHAYRAIFFLSFGIMGLGAHFGGNMSHGNKFLTQHAPPWLKTQMVAMEKFALGFVEPAEAIKTTAIVATTPPPPPAVAAAGPKPNAATPAPASTPPVAAKTSTPPPVTPPILGGISPAVVGGEDKLVFQHVLLPIFEAKCNKCHNESKSKGGLRLDSYEMAMKGGDNDKVKNIIPGKPDDSLSIQLISLAEDDDDHMPPDGKDQLTKEEIALFRWWVQEGAKETQKVADAKFPPEAQPAVDAVLNDAANPNLSALNPQ